MKEINVIKLFYKLPLWGVSFFLITSVVGHAATESTENVKEKISLWSSRAENKLKLHGDKFSTVEDFYIFSNPSDNFYLLFWLVSLMMGLYFNMLITDNDPINFKLKVIFFGIFSIFIIFKMLVIYLPNSKNGYFFLTDKGLIIVNPNNILNGNTYWFKYSYIDSVELTWLGRNSPIMFLHIIDKNGRRLVYKSTAFRSFFECRDFFLHLLEKRDLFTTDDSMTKDE